MIYASTICTLVIYAVGLLVSVMGSIAATGCFVEWVCSSYYDWRYEPHKRSFERGKEYVRNTLKNDSWWFSEDYPTQQLLEGFGNGKSVSEIRDRWYEQRAVKGLQDGKTD